jgi:hypothetical protein
MFSKELNLLRNSIFSLTLSNIISGKEILSFCNTFSTPNISIPFFIVIAFFVETN